MNHEHEKALSDSLEDLIMGMVFPSRPMPPTPPFTRGMQPHEKIAAEKRWQREMNEYLEERDTQEDFDFMQGTSWFVSVGLAVGTLCFLTGIGIIAWFFSIDFGRPGWVIAELAFIAVFELAVVFRKKL